MNTKKSLLLALLVVSMSFAAAAQPLKMTISRVGNHIDITAGKKLVTSYRFYEDEKYPYFFPVNGPVSGGSLTAMRNSLYPHQSSMYLTSDKLNGANYWQDTLEAGQILSQGPRIVPGDEYHVIIEDECLWVKPGQKLASAQQESSVLPVQASVRDHRRMTFSAPSEDLYQIDFEIEMEMLEDVVILKTIHSLFCVRMAEDLSVKQGGQVTNSRGDTGIDGCFGVRAPWLDATGTRKSGTEGIAILQHPSSLWYPAPWFVRDYGLFSPSLIYWPENGKDTKFSKGEVIHLKYRVLVHAGSTQEADIEGLFRQFANEK